VPIVSKSGSLSLLEPCGPLIGSYRNFLTFTSLTCSSCNF
jgi:hypothetical protein